MEQRIDTELALVRARFPEAEYQPDDHWVRIPSYGMPQGWNRPATDVAFQIPVGYPGVPPYGIYVPSGLLFQGTAPGNYTDPCPTQPPFPGTWAIFSWAPADGEWRATAEANSGSNLLGWIAGFAARFREGV
jgi:hypothetical protein